MQCSHFRKTCLEKTSTRHADKCYYLVKYVCMSVYVDLGVSSLEKPILNKVLSVSLRYGWIQ